MLHGCNRKVDCDRGAAFGGPISIMGGSSQVSHPTSLGEGLSATTLKALPHETTATCIPDLTLADRKECMPSMHIPY